MRLKNLNPLRLFEGDLFCICISGYLLILESFNLYYQNQDRLLFKAVNGNLPAIAIYHYHITYWINWFLAIQLVIVSARFYLENMHRYRNSI